MEARDKLMKAIRECDNCGFSKILENMSSDAVNETDEFGTTALHVACGATNNHEAVRKLLNITNAPVNAKGKGAFTPAMVAAGYCSLDCLNLLLQDTRVDIDLTDKRGQRLEDIVAIAGGCSASSRQRQEVIARIREERERRARPSAPSREDLDKIEDNVKNINLKEGDGAAPASAPIPEGGEGTGDMDAAKNNLECPICLNEMRPPLRIWMCSSTHVICENCKNKLENDICPTCRSSPVSIRAFFAENMARSLFENQ